METKVENLNFTKQRHGFLTAWLILMIILNLVASLFYFFASEMIKNNSPVAISNQLIILFGILGIGNVIFSVMLLKWKKIGFWGFALTNIGRFIINLIIGYGIGQSLFGLVGFVFLYGILQIKKDNVTGWKNLE